MGQNIGFISTRFSGTDGVSLESAKWAEVLWHHEHISYWYAGILDRADDISMLVPEASFDHPDIAKMNEEAFGTTTRSRELTRSIYDMAEYLKGTIYQFVERYNIDILIVQNALCIPMNIPLGVALTHFVVETGFPTIAHHHDFYWERTRFTPNSVGDLLTMAFPPALSTIQHATINSAGQQALSHRRGISSILVPNVLNFEVPPPPIDDYCADFRQAIGVSDEDILVVQPTRVVPRKGIEHAISLISELRDDRVKLIITHKAGDEGYDYKEAIGEMAARQNVQLLFVDNRIGEKRGLDEHGKKLYSLWDAYQHADLITYPSIYEGFGNALLEAFYFRKPVVVNRYSIYIDDIEPKGFEVIAMNGFITKQVVDSVRRLLTNPEYRAEMVEHNYAVASRFFSYSVLRRKLRALVTNFTGADNL
ncbi:Alpha-D-kanosaminyltransferase [Planctomycetes bacterium Pan216]|uniref:Alpha-D-kanosaminyltransferase n=1 Tax=Kolteria novifilia TaxID=2527975 RepID=A0A518BCH9_9BACT|nr:Alpha-D-kanosaminyltransferase [Planctomycetes bacterium Pan216]